MIDLLLVLIYLNYPAYIISTNDTSTYYFLL